MSRIRKSLKNNKGMSIIELLLVILITLMIITMLLISYVVINKSDVRKSARRLENVLRTARVTAMSKGRTEGTITFSPDGGNIYATIGSNDRQLICGGGVSIYAIKNTLNYTVSPLISNGFSSGTVVFDSSGRMNASSTVNIFKLQKGRKAFLVRVYEETGYVEVEETTPFM